MGQDGINVHISTWRYDNLALVCGIANAGGGTITVINTGKNSVSDLRKMRRSYESIPDLVRTELGLDCSAEPVMFEGKLCLEIAIPKASIPVSFERNYYLYKDEMNSIVSPEVFEQDALSNADSMTDVDWELIPQPITYIESFDRNVVMRLLKGMGDSGGDAETGNATPNLVANRLLEMTGLCDPATNHLNNAALLLLHEKPSQVIPGAFIQVGFFDGQSLMPFLHDEIDGPLLSQLDKACELLYEKYFPKGAKRGLIPDKVPPHNVFREALLNALVHKDYASGAAIRIAITPKEVSVENAGAPPKTWDMDTFSGRHMSRPNNPVIASILQQAHEFSGWGNGISSIIEDCKRNKVATPVFELRPDETCVILPIAPATEPIASGSADTAATASTNSGHASLASSAVGTSEAASASTPTSGSGSTPFKEKSIAAARRLNLTGTDEYILKVLATNGRATASQIASFLGISTSTVNRSFRKLKDYDLLERVGSDKAGWWNVKL